jgi:hypothetical protein
MAVSVGAPASRPRIDTFEMRRSEPSQEDSMVSTNKKLLLGAVIVAVMAAWSGMTIGADGSRPSKESENRMSGMGHHATHARTAIDAGLPAVGAAKNFDQDGDCVNQPDCPGEDGPPPDGPASTQSETAIAVDSTGQHVVVGFNDFRGFNLNPISVSGFMYSDDGGVTFVDGGQLPSPGTDVIGTTRLPEVFGDPDIKYLGGCTFSYSSIIVKKFSATTAVQTMGVHRSTDCGHTWVGPFEVTPATNPHGLVSASGSPLDASDKEFTDVDPDTGRVILSWSNFTPAAAGGVEISTTFSDNFTTATPPTWSPRQIVAATTVDGQGSIPRFAGRGSPNAYVAWSRFPGGLSNNIGFARSTNNGATWSAPVNLAANFFTMDQVLGNDRVHNFPSMAVDRSHSRHRGNIYVVYASNNNQDGADISFQRSADEGFTFSAPVLINSRPGHDRAQWFPAISVDTATGRIHVFYNDQGIAASGDLMEFTHTSSDDGGHTWEPPQPISIRPFHAGWGNDTSQPNLGDYNQTVAQNGTAFVTYALASRPPAGFADGQPTSASLTVPDVQFAKVTNGRREDDEDGEEGSEPTTVNINGVSVTESGGNGFIDPGDTVRLKIGLRNYVTNPLNARTVEDMHAVLSTSTPGVVVRRARAEYEDIHPGRTQVNEDDFVLRIRPTFAPGTPIELVLKVGGEENGRVTLHHTLFTGTPLATTLLMENFNTTAPGALPAGWVTAHGGGANTVPWTTSNTFCNTTSNAAFHQNAADGPGPGAFTNTRFERLFSPMFVVPGDADYVTIDMDVCYDTEDDPAFNILAFDGFLLRVTDMTPGRLLRSVLVEAFEDAFRTGSFFHYPKHFPRSGNSAYFQDMSAWAGDSQGVKHVRMRLPGMAGSTAQLRFEFTQDSIGTCSDVRPGHACGVSFDNLVVRSVKSVVP